jgi:putative ABC transport system permease protein
MAMPFSNPMYFVALKMLFGDRIKFFTLVVGLTFSVLLITQQGSIFCGIMRRFTSTITNTHAPIWIANKDIRFIDDVKPLLDTDLPRVRSIPGVQWAVPLLQRISQVQLANGKIENIILLGVDSQSLIGCPQNVVAGDIRDLNTPDAAVVDKRGLRKLGPLKVGDTFEVNDHRMRVVAIVNIPSGFQSLPYIYTTYDRALSILPRQRKLLSFVLAKAKPGVNEETLVKQIQAQTGLGAFTEQQFLWRTLEYFLKNTGIAINFGITVTLGRLGRGGHCRPNVLHVYHRKH